MQRDVERADEPRQVVEHAEAAAADRVGDGRADADRRVAHDDVGEPEHRVGERLAPGDERPALLADHPQRDGEDDAEDDDLQHVAPGHRIDDRLRDGVQQHLVPGLRRRRHFSRPGRRQRDPVAGTRDVHRDEADEEGDRRDHLEVDDRAHAHAADRFHVARPRRAGDQGREDQRRDDHLDQAQEQLAERPDVLRPRRIDVVDVGAKRNPDRQTDEDLLGQPDAALPLFRGHVCQSSSSPSSPWGIIVQCLPASSPNIRVVSRRFFSPKCGSASRTTGCGRS